ncbi:MAG: Na(+)-translocating NADH-quinone reductase subunit C [Desulfobulbaceae bacterium]|nr:Na(+)-translocating NADH-quinone reductase subunit C [Desulfobulbaceae bacterium]HIJ79919.1 Na(+)-translocating NADH-quinone reductase subunit C [Deltaproteobacteria bacterium]
MAKESPAKPFYSVLILALVCSMLVAGAAVGLRPRQETNRKFDQKKNILRAAGLYHGQGGQAEVEKLFQAVETKIIRLSDGSVVKPAEIEPATFNQLKAAFNPETGRALTKEEDQAGLGRRENYSLVYLVKKNDRLDKVILPVRGKGLWSTMYGYVALANDLATINGITFYQHGETPGLGGEIENETWQAGWAGKKIHNLQGEPVLRVVKGKSSGEESRYQIDGISGATLTMNGVSNMMSFWFGDHGFKPFLERYKNRGDLDG